MNWRIDYSKQAKEFIVEHKIAEKVRDSLRDLILKVRGQSINIDIKKLKGKWDGYLRIRKGRIRIIIQIFKQEKRVFVQRIDFRGNVY
jgi:mRNA interferase RelE/StbE